MTYEIRKEIEFDAGHRVPRHASKCRNPHGHRYKVVATIVGDLITEGPETGMVRDFGIVKELMTLRIHDVFDHSFIVYEGDPLIMDAFRIKDGESTYGFKVVVVPFHPTAEALAMCFYDILKEDLPNLIEIAVHETPTSVATYREG